MRLQACAVVVAGTLVMVGATRALAQVSAGLNEVNVAVSITSSKSSGTNIDTDARTTGVFSGAYGRFLTDHIEVGAQLTGLKTEDEDMNGTVGAIGAYHFGGKNNAIVPFAGAQIGRGYGLNMEVFSARIHNPWSYGVFGGIKAFVPGGGGAITVQPFWTRQTRSYEGLGFSDHVHQDTYGISTGISLFFR